MSTPPQPSPHQAPPYAKPPSSGVPRYVLIGCASLLLVFILGAVAIYWVFQYGVAEVVSTFTSDSPAVSNNVTLDASQMAALDERVRLFSEALNSQTSTSPLVLSSDELNALVQRQVSRWDPNAVARVRVFGRQIESDVSIPLRESKIVPGGRYLNGKASITVGVQNGRVEAYLRELKVGDSYIPDAIRRELENENLLHNVYEEKSDISRALEKIRDVEVRDGTVTLYPAN